MFTIIFIIFIIVGIFTKNIEALKIGGLFAIASSIEILNNNILNIFNRK